MRAAFSITCYNFPNRQCWLGDPVLMKRWHVARALLRAVEPVDAHRITQPCLFACTKKVGTIRTQYPSSPTWTDGADVLAISRVLRRLRRESASSREDTQWHNPKE